MCGQVGTCCVNVAAISRYSHILEKLIQKLEVEETHSWYG